MHERKDWLESALADAELPLADEGFTRRVMRALPPEPRAHAFERSDWILLGGAAVGSAAVAAQFPFAPFLNLLVESANTTWVGALVMLACMAGVLLVEPLRNSL